MSEQEDQVQQITRDIMAIGRLLWDKELVTGLNGNISARVDFDKILLTAHNTCLGLLQEKDLILMKLDEKFVGQESNVSTEKLLHTEIYKNFPEAKAVIHTHTTYTNAYFLNNPTFDPRIFEAKFYLGQVNSIEQHTPAVTDAKPVIESLKSNNITVLRNHGVVAMGTTLFDSFLLIQGLEEAIKTEAMSRLFGGDQSAGSTAPAEASQNGKKYKLFSQEQIDEVVRLCNSDAKLKELGASTNMDMDLAVKLNETGDVFSFQFEKGQIKNVGRDENVEFLISAPTDIWRAVFNQEIDPFVATTQKKMDLKGDFAKISKWYAPCSRIFELWTHVPVE